MIAVQKNLKLLHQVFISNADFYDIIHFTILNFFNVWNTYNIRYLVKQLNFSLYIIRNYSFQFQSQSRISYQEYGYNIIINYT